MARPFLTTTAHHLPLPPKVPNGSSNFAATTTLTKQQRCLALLRSCSSMVELHQIHAHLLASGLLRAHAFFTDELLRFCSLAPSGCLPYARRLLDQTPYPTRLSYNHVIRGFSRSDAPAEAFAVFFDMRRRCASRPNELTFPFVLSACARLSMLALGTQVHADALKNGVGSVVYVQNTLMHLYGSGRKMTEVNRVFDEMTERTVVSWNTVLMAYVDNSQPEESLRLFARLRGSRFEPDETMFVILLSASAEVGSLSFGRWIHRQIIGTGLPVNYKLGTALVNMYAKCGAIECATLVFERIPMKNVWTWSTMILGFAQHGSAKHALQLFAQMKESSIEPSYVTFLGVLCACSHSGLVDEGRQFFHEMIHVHGIRPRMAHYSAMVDILGRRGCLDEAYDFIRSMPIEPDAVVWRTLLSTCQIHSANDTSGIGEIARERLIMLEPTRSGNYVMAANMYAEVGSWEEAASVRRVMREEGLKKLAAESCIEVGGSLHKFISGDVSCIIRNFLFGLNLNMKLVGDVEANSFTDPIDII